jgi:amidase
VPVPDYLVEAEAGAKGLRIGVDPNWNRMGVDAATTAALQAALTVLQQLGCELRPVRFPDAPSMVEDWYTLCGVETAIEHEATYPSRRGEYGPALASLIDLGRGTDGIRYGKATIRRNDLRGRLSALFEEIDLLAVPAQAFAAPSLAEMSAIGERADQIAGLLRFTCPFDLSAQPTITLPCGRTDAGMPIAFQLVASHFAEATLVRAGIAFQAATDWHRRHPLP